MRRNIFLLLCGLGLVLAVQACGPMDLSGGAGYEPEPTEAFDLTPMAVYVPPTMAALPTMEPPEILIPVTGGGGPEPTPADAIPAPTMTALPTTGGGSDDAAFMPAIPESRSLTLEFPPRMRAGDGNSVRLTLEVTEQGILPTAEVEGHITTMQVVEIPNLYDTHSVVAEARLDLAGMAVQPEYVVTQSLLPGQSVTYYWSVRTDNPGRYSGRVWLSLRFLPFDGGPESSRVIAAPPLEIEVVTFMGLKAGMARWIGAIGSVLGTLFSVPFLEDGLRWVWRRKRG